MMSTNDLFYGEREPVWIVDTSASPLVRVSTSFLKPESDRYGSYRKRHSGYPQRQSAYDSGYGSDYRTDDRYSDYYNNQEVSYVPSSRTSYVSPATYARYDDEYYGSSPDYEYSYSYDRRPMKRTVLKVPICCETCAEEARNTLREIHGVRSVYCDVPHEKIIVTGTAAPADILIACKKLHKKSRFWTQDDY